ncbi:hypothetical protein BKP35_02745 [Anaerobacillus arseniciselenatis]|uniref:DUF309 domain-containing protein n=1 Tax=Anaerobacillus arseniciselenatis TaxID=85682 RepID=A0A1S2LUP8_9BACI|nr:DUF309 domain-containing protein [Anaerobacillus arseniciselenatis]OIJ15920.1 hypothetical protein BKP35_02745 [Anaerobacillus arseniciselenatis]
MYPKAYIDYLVYFHSFRDYFECHEALEEHWKQEGKANKVWVGLIQLAVAMYHHRRGNFKGANKQLMGAIKILKEEKGKLSELGINETKLMDLLYAKQIEIKKQLPYYSLSIPLNDPTVIEYCKKNSQEKGRSWGEKNIKVSIELIDKHKLRDRSQIIEERKQQLNRKRNR